jgi:hypothetical protein
MVRVDAGGDTVLCMTQMNLSARAYPYILKISQAGKRSNLCVWRMRCSIGPS